MYNKHIFSYIFWFFILIGFQIVVLNHLSFYGRMYLMVYPLFILALPVNLPASIVVLCSFLAGITIDIFSNGGGLHAASLLFLGYLRKYLFLLIPPKAAFSQVQMPTIAAQGFNWFFLYAAISIVIHHLAFFYLEAFSFSSFFIVLLKVIMSAVGSLCMMLIFSVLLLSDTKE